MAHAVLRSPILALALLAALSAAAGQGQARSYVVAGSPADGLERCVEPTEFMRRNHMELIQHQRDKTVHLGIRGTPHSLAGCVDCHVSYDAQREPVPVVADGQFCRTCHAHAAVKLNCFQCHATVPVEDERVVAGQAEVFFRSQPDGPPSQPQNDRQP